MPLLHRFFASLCLAFCTALIPAQAAPGAVTLAELRAQFERIPSTADSSEDVKPLLSQIAAIKDSTELFVSVRSGLLNDLNAQLQQLGSGPAPGAAPESPDVTRHRARLEHERSALDADIRLARLLELDAQQRSSELLDKRRRLFEAQLFERVNSPLTPAFWSDLREDWPADQARFAALGQDLRQGLAASPWAPLLRSLVLALMLIVPGNLLVVRLLVRLTRAQLAPGRLRRSLLVIASVGTSVLLTHVATRYAYNQLDALQTWSPQALKLAWSVAQLCVFAAFVVSLGQALLSNARPTWRLLALPNAVALRLAPLPALVALVASLVWLPAQINSAIDAGLAALELVNLATALALCALTGYGLWRLRPPRAGAPWPVGIRLLRAGVALTQLTVLLLAGLGYLALASFLASQLTWCAIVACAFYALLRFSDDLFERLLSAQGTLGQPLRRTLDLAPSTLNQIAVAGAGLSRVLLFFYALVTLVTPLGTSPDEVLARGARYGAGWQIGAYHLVPGAVLNAALVLALGLIAVGVLRRWLEHRYLPQTQLQAGMRSSIATLLGYAGQITVLALALSTLGLGVERIAWIASALSVGIGFGLQAIVQNFISGLILLAERPVKVGDWVVLGQTEGDIRRINVRATEIQLADRSTVIVPNSEFVTKTVQNMTLTRAGGRVLLNLPMPLSSDADQVRQLLLATLRGHAQVQHEPAPLVLLSGIEHGQLMFQAIGFVADPRQAAVVRSELWFAMLQALRVAGLPLLVPTLAVLREDDNNVGPAG